MEIIYYVGLDIHKKTISYCVKQIDGRIVRHGVVAATRKSLTQWVGSLDRPWVGAMEATLFTGWVYDFLKPCALELKVRQETQRHTPGKGTTGQRGVKLG